VPITRAPNRVSYGGQAGRTLLFMRNPRMQNHCGILNTHPAARFQNESGENSFTNVRPWFRHFHLTCSQTRTPDGSADKGSTLGP
jgi:hypothetical protein